MGNGKLIEAVADSGPLIHLAEINCLPLLNIFNKLHIPHAVWLETVERNRICRNDLSSVTNIQRCLLQKSEVANFIVESKLTELHAGEKECLFLCRQRGIVNLLTDDLAVRDAAKGMNLVPVGSLGIIVKAYKQEKLAILDAERYISALYDVSSLFVTRTIVDLAIEQLRTIAKK